MTCRICGSNKIALVINVKEMMIPTREEFTYFECADCHCLQIKTIPDNLGDYYGDDYYSYQDTAPTEENLPSTDTTPILDVGSGAGDFLKKLHSLGYSNLTGCDPFLPDDITYDHNFHIYKRTIHQMEGKFDQIFMNDSFEHVSDPHEVFDSIKRLLAPEGICYIKIPIYPNIAFDLFGADWYQLDAPRHIFLHSKESMIYLASAHGLNILEIEYDSNPSQIFRSYMYSKDIPFYEQKMADVIDMLGREEVDNIKKLSKEANENGYGDHAIFYLSHK